jgi:hypothetical protein
MAGCAGDRPPAGPSLGVVARFATSCPDKGAPQPDGEPPADVKTFVVTISGGALDAPMKREITRGSENYITIDGIPAGTGYTVTVEGKGGSSWKGVIKDLSFTDGKKTEARVYMTRVEAFTCGPDMGDARFLHAAAKLGDGRLLITGGVSSIGDPTCSINCCTSGCDGDAVAGTDIYDPVTGTLTRGPGMKNARAGHTATTLSDGRVAVAGGLSRVTFTPGASTVQVANAAGAALVAPVEVYDPATGKFAEAGMLVTPRFLHSAAALSGRRMVLAGGGKASLVALAPNALETNAADTVELYDAGKKTAQSFVMGYWHFAPGMAPVDEDRVLIFGGTDPAKMIAEVFDPGLEGGGGTVKYTTVTTSKPEQAAPFFASVVPLGSKKFLVRGGMYLDTAAPGWQFLPITEGAAMVLDIGPKTPTLSIVQGPSSSLIFSAAVAGSEVLICGGTEDFVFAELNMCERRDPASGAKKGTAEMLFGRVLATATLLDDGTVLVAGGAADLGGNVPKILVQTEIYRMP